MKTDPIVEEVREARRKLAEKFQFDSLAYRFALLRTD